MKYLKFIVYNSFENFNHYKQQYYNQKDLKLSTPINIDQQTYRQWIRDDALCVVLQYLLVDDTDDEIVFKIRLASKQFLSVIFQDQFFERWLTRIDPRTKKVKDPYCIRIPNGDIIWRHGWVAFDNEDHCRFNKPVMQHKGRRVNSLNPLVFRILRSLFLLNLYQTSLGSQDRKIMNTYYHESRFIRNGVMNFNLMIDHEKNKKEFIIYLEFYMLHYIKTLHLQKLTLKINVFFNYQLVRFFDILFSENYRILNNFAKVNTKNRFLFTSAISKQEIETIVRTLIKQRLGRPDLNQGNHFSWQYEYVQQLQNEQNNVPIPNSKRQKLQ